ncbi:MAG: hypothetical protein CL920_35650 [Deltaproteobacteria bacterium]|nr:hypothetical protein [Deltaproteobacteria bacterium]MBU54061.1 hypothetical protein [Deltaproteobacteria bacterium]
MTSFILLQLALLVSSPTINTKVTRCHQSCQITQLKCIQVCSRQMMVCSAKAQTTTNKTRLPANFSCMKTRVKCMRDCHHLTKKCVRGCQSTCKTRCKTMSNKKAIRYAYCLHTHCGICNQTTHAAAEDMKKRLLTLSSKYTSQSLKSRLTALKRKAEVKDNETGVQRRARCRFKHCNKK